ncbi:hypothetical protein B6S44_16215 [Bosea sp. Tri-44]|uniref:LytTR family DNA-binding domain-containing protein n=1 Tax=Bosea sp. Tri-44 TaxID=1972137 RepID=UPI00100E52A7|nr:LytTR family DNA-binding domain-containing protein [Bosea sp. Tri-44]RXT53481.1 hypothetical protein B6S44_16215 [Bosea sp. Tri-44]
MLRDESQRAGTSGGEGVTNGEAPALQRAARGLPAWTLYLLIAAGTAATCAVNAFSTLHDFARYGRAVPFWQPVLWEASSGIVILALAPLVRRLVLVSLAKPPGPAALIALHAAAVLAFSALHVTGMILLRKLGYWAAGAGDYSFGLSPGNLLYELRKDVLVYLLLAGLFWLAELWARRPMPHRIAADATPVASGFWLRDGTINLRLDPAEIVAVISAGNYVEYCLDSGKRHLIRATLQAEEERLRTLGFARIHRTRLVNAARIRRIASRPSGDFDVEMDTGESLVGSRRYRDGLSVFTP